MFYTQNRIAFAAAAVLILVGCEQKTGVAPTAGLGVSKEASSKLDALIKSAESGDPKSQLDLATRYLRGDGVEESLPRAFELWMKSAEGGNAEAMYLVGEAYRDGFGTTKDQVKATAWIKRAAEAGNADAQFKHAATFGATERNTWIFGNFGKLEERQEYARQYVEWLDKAAKQNQKEAQYALGMTYLLGAYENSWADSGKKIIESDIEKALPLLQSSADAGFWRSQWALAVLYQSGFGKVKADKEVSEKYWKLLSDQSDPEAMFQIGLFYHTANKKYYKDGKNKYQGQKLDFDATNKVAFEWYLKAAEKGSTGAMHNLGLLFLTGSGVIKDEQKALEYFRQAAENGYFASMHKLAFAYLNGQGVVKDYAEAHKWLLKSAAEDDKSAYSEVHKARNALGALYEYGWGIEKDLVLAYAWYNIAASGGYEKAKQNLARVEKAIKDDELREAQTLSREWKPGRPMVRSDSQPTGSAGSDGKPAVTNTVSSSFKLATVGTGFFVSPNGNVITNNHVVDGCGEIRIPAHNITAKLVVADQANDLALIKIEVVGKPVLAFPSGDDLKQGEEVFAFGFPLDGYLPSAGNVTTGIVSALAGPGNNSSLIQTTAPVQPGNSGGPLLNKKGKVVGVVVGKANAIKIAKVTGDIPQNINFAIAPRTVKSFLDGNRVEYQKKGDTFSFDKDSVAIADEARKATMKIECWR